MASKQKHNDAFVGAPPGNNLLSFLDNFPIAKEIAKHIGLVHIIDDHQCMWEEAKTDEDKVKIHQRFRRQVGRGLVSFGGFEIAFHGVVSTAFGQWLVGSSLIMVGAFILHIMRR